MADPKQVKTRHTPTRPCDPGNARTVADEEPDWAISNSPIRMAHFISHHPKEKVDCVPCHGDPEMEK
jgi:hypothetical protein